MNAFFCCTCSIVKLQKQKSKHFYRSAQQHSLVSELLQCCLQMPENHLNFIGVNRNIIFGMNLFFFGCSWYNFFVAETGIVLNLLLNFEQKWVTWSDKIILIKKLYSKIIESYNWEIFWQLFKLKNALFSLYKPALLQKKRWLKGHLMSANQCI